MPMGKFYRYKKPAKKATRKRTRRVTSLTAKNTGGFPAQKRVKFRYVEEILLNATVGNGAFFNYTANGMYDPNITGIGHQPLNYDIWMNMYDHYRVVGSKIKVTYAPSSTSNTTPSYLGLYLSDNTIGMSSDSIANILENDKVKFHRNVIGPVGVTPYPVVTGNFNAKKFFGPSSLSDKHQGAVSANPSDQAYFQIMQLAVGDNDPGSINLLVEIEYDCILTERKKGVPS